MNPTIPTHGEDLQAGSHAPYIRVFLALALFTAIEYFYAKSSRRRSRPW